MLCLRINRSTGLRLLLRPLPGAHSSFPHRSPPPHRRAWPLQAPARPCAWTATPWPSTRPTSGAASTTRPSRPTLAAPPQARTRGVAAALYVCVCLCMCMYVAVPTCTLSCIPSFRGRSAGRLARHPLRIGAHLSAALLKLHRGRIGPAVGLPGALTGQRLDPCKLLARRALAAARCARRTQTRCVPRVRVCSLRASTLPPCTLPPCRSPPPPPPLLCFGRDRPFPSPPAMQNGSSCAFRFTSGQPVYLANLTAAGRAAGGAAGGAAGAGSGAQVAKPIGGSGTGGRGAVAR
jgi:hypothetical protein